MGIDMTLAQAIAGATAADPAFRIEFRDLIASHGAAGIEAVQPWLRSPDLARFAIRVIVRAGELGEEKAAIALLRSESAEPWTEFVGPDLQWALERLGARPGSIQGARRASNTNVRPEGSFTPQAALVQGRVYGRRALHASGWGGNWQSGISYPAKGEHVLLFSDPSKAAEHGYKDQWVGEGRYRYYGAWNGTGDMVLTGSNQVILDRTPELHLLIRETDGWRYEGQFECLGYERARAVRDGREFNAIVFTLRRLPSVTHEILGS